MISLSVEVHNFINHKNELISFFNGEEVKENLIKVDSEIAEGFIFLYQPEDDVHFVVFQLKLKKDVQFEIDYSKAKHFEKVASFFNSTTYVKSFTGEKDQEIKKDGFFTCNKEVRLKGIIKKGKYLNHISLFYTDTLFDSYEDETYRNYFQNLDSFMIYLDHHFELKMFNKSLQNIYSYPHHIILEILQIKLQELKFIFLSRLRQLDIEKLESKANVISNYHLEILFNIRDMILSDLTVRPNVGDLIQEYGVNKMLIQRLFQETFGYTIYNFFTIQRMEKAKEALLDKGMSTTEVAYEFGFTDVQHFSKQFKKAFGETPTNYYNRFNT